MADTESVASVSTATEKENLDRLLKIFNGGTGINLGTLLARVIEAQWSYDSAEETQFDLELADFIMAVFHGWKVRKDPKYRIMMEEGKGVPPISTTQDVHDEQEEGVPPIATKQDVHEDKEERRVTLNDKKQTPRAIPHLTQRVKTFYMDHALTTDPILIPKLPTKSARARSMIGGTPITKETAIQLRNLTLGSTVHSFSLDWRRSSLIFHDIASKHSYGLQTNRCGSRTLVLCVQGYLLKHLLFAREYSSSLSTKSAIKPTEFERRKALCGALCNILWQAGNNMRCCVCLQQEEAIFDTDYTYRVDGITEKEEAIFDTDYTYRVDGITEKLHLYEFKKYQDLEMFIKRHLSHFETESSNGCILFLYSVILSRTVIRILEDMNVTETSTNARLLTDNEQCLPALLNLLLTGRAVQNFHNGNIVYDQDGNLLPMPLRGIKERSQVGLLYWDKHEDRDERTEIGSMLKTPKYPIWMTLVNGQYGILFSLNPDLVSDWRVEHHFILYYFTGLSSNTSTQLTIETLAVPKQEEPAPTKYTRYTRRLRIRAKTGLTRKLEEEKIPPLEQCILTNILAKTGMTRKLEEEKIPPLEQCILTKWYGANIDWNGVFPFV